MYFRANPGEGPRLARLLCLVALTSCLACGGDRVLIDVSVTGLPGTATALAIDARLPRPPGASAAPMLTTEVTRSLERFVLRAPAGAQGPLSLQVDALGSDECPLSHTPVPLTIPFTGEPRITVTVSLQALQAPGCHLKVLPRGDGKGKVSGRRLDCGPSCDVTYPRGEQVELTVQPDPDSIFGGWSGACTGLGRCRVRIDGPQQKVEASFLRKEVCTPEGWCWLNPRPDGSTLRALHAVSGSEAWAAGDTGLVLRWNGSSWVPYPIDTRGDMSGVYGRGPDEAFALALDGRVWRFDGERFTEETTGLAPGELGGLQGCGPSRLFAYGLDRVVFRDDRGWAEVPARPQARLLGLTCASAESLWLAGEDGGAYHVTVRGDRQFTLDRETPLPRPPRLLSLVAVDGETVWAAGIDAASGLPQVSRRRPGGVWEPIPLPGAAPSATATVFFAASAEDAWIALDDGLLYHVQGAAAAPIHLPVPLNLLAMSGIGPEDVWAVGEGGGILRWNGLRWQLQRGSVYDTLGGIWGSAPDRLFIGSHDGPLLRYDGSQLLSETVPLQGLRDSLWGHGADYVVATGLDGGLLTFDGSAWQTSLVLDLGVARCGPSAFSGFPGGGFVVGFCFDGRQSTAVVLRSQTARPFATTAEVIDVFTLGVIPPTPAPLAVWAAGPDAAWAVGERGSVWRLDAGRLRTFAVNVPSIEKYTLFSVWGSASDDVWISGAATTEDVDSALLLHVRAGTVEKVPLPEGMVILNAIWGSARDDVWAVGFGIHGSILHYDGARWQLQSSLVNTFNGVFGIGRHVWVAGSSGALLHLPPEAHP